MGRKKKATTTTTPKKPPAIAATRKPMLPPAAPAPKPAAPAPPISTLPPAQKYPSAAVVKSAAPDVAGRLEVVRFCLFVLFQWVRLTAKAPGLLKRRDIVVKLRKAIQELDAGNVSEAKTLAASAKLDLKVFLDQRIAAGRKDLAAFKL